MILLAIVFNSDNGGLFAGSLSKALWQRQRPYQPTPHHSQPHPKPQHQPQRLTTTTTTTAPPGILSVASPNKTWAGVIGAVALGTATALALRPGLRLLSVAFSSSLGSGRHEGFIVPEEAFSLGGMGLGLLGAAGAGICVVGVVGDLWESLLKRMAMVKVSGWGLAVCGVGWGGVGG